MRKVGIWLFVLAGLGAVVFVMFEGWTLKKRASTHLSTVAHDNLLWHALAVGRQTLLLREALIFAVAADVAARDPGPATGRPLGLDEPEKDVGLQFDLLWNTIEVAGSGRIGENFESIDERRVLADIMATLRRREAAVVGGAILSAGPALAFANELRAYQRPLHQLASRAEQHEHNRIAAIRSDLARLGELDTRVAIGLAVISCLGAFGVYRSGRNDLRRSRQLRALAQETMEAARSRARFLTMVSHEMRTPMNGVLGTLELLRAGEPSEDQRHLLEHAALSATAMTQVVEALLEMSDIQDGRAAPDVTYFPIDAFRKDLDTRLTAATMDDPGSIRLAVIGEGRFCGDRRRMAQIAAYLINHARGQMAAPVCACRIVFAKEMRLTLTLTYETDVRRHVSSLMQGRLADDCEDHEAALDPARAEMGEGGEGATLDSMAERLGDRLDADALAPLIAQQMTALLGGRYRAMTADDTSFAIEVVIPAARAAEGETEAAQATAPHPTPGSVVAAPPPGRSRGAPYDGSAAKAGAGGGGALDGDASRA